VDVFAAATQLRVGMPRLGSALQEMEKMDPMESTDGGADASPATIRDPSFDEPREIPTPGGSRLSTPTIAPSTATPPASRPQSGRPVQQTRTYDSDPQVGSILGQYRLEERIGAGGMGIVYRATDLEALRLKGETTNVAIKVMKSELRDKNAALLSAVNVVKDLQQENIINVYGFQSDGDRGFIVMEYMSGIPLDKFVTGNHPDGLPFDRAVAYIRAMGNALSFAHQHNVVHSDFKPSNVFVIPDSAKVLDFDIARAARTGYRADSSGELPSGLTPEFASCEMLEGQPADRRDDVFCFALVVYFLLSGTHPFDGQTALVARRKKLTVPRICSLTRRQHAALQRALRFDRAERTRRIEEVVAGLEAGIPPSNRWPLWCGLGVAALATGAAALIYLGPQDSDSEFLLDRCSASAAPAGQTATQQEIDTLLQLGQDDLRNGTNPFDPGLLSENVSSAWGSFKHVAEAGPATCREGARGMLNVVKAYKHEAKRLYDAGNYAMAGNITGIALTLWPNSTDLKHLQRRIQTHLQEPDG
jgi:serine/threonine protein kinase